MRPRRTPTTRLVFTLPGGTEDNDLWVRVGESDGAPTLESVWELTPVERRAVADGANIVLTVFGAGMPPVDMRITDEQLGRGDA